MEHAAERKAYNAKYREEHRDELRAKGRAYMKSLYWAEGETGRQHRERQEKKRRQRDPEKVKATKIAWKKNNPEAVKRHKRTEYERHHEKIKARVRRWVENNPDMRRAQTLKRRSLQKNAAGADYTTAQHIRWRIDLYGGRCYYCGAEADTIDHRIPLVRGGSHWPASLVPACRSCNSRKHDKTELEFRAAA